MHSPAHLPLQAGRGQAARERSVAAAASADASQLAEPSQACFPSEVKRSQLPRPRSSLTQFTSEEAATQQRAPTRRPAQVTVWQLWLSGLSAQWGRLEPQKARCPGSVPRAQLHRPGGPGGQALIASLETYNPSPMLAAHWSPSLSGL